MSASNNRQYSISDLSREFDVTNRALRLYEESGLLSPVREGQKRIYSERDRVRVRLIMRGKRIGYSLAEIKELFDMYDDSRHGERAQLRHLLDKLRERRAILELQRRELALSLADIEQIEQRAREALRELEAKEKQHG
ncbi:MAG: MerR family DNA-binding transcriptional regulator [Thiolinea sp.]